LTFAGLSSCLLEKAPEALVDLFQGRNIGKVIVRIAQ
jgi:NADPH-dependent curcumin reductase CurA